MKSPIELSNGRETVKIYKGTSRGRPYFQLSFYRAGRRERRTFSNKDAAKREAKVVLGQLATNSEIADTSMTVSDIESLVAARAALEGFAVPLHLAIEGFAGAVRKLGMPADPFTALHQAVSFYVKHHPIGSARIPLGEMTQRYVDSRNRVGLSKGRVNAVGVATRAMLKEFPAENLDLPSGDEIVKWLDKKYESAVTKNSTLKTLKAFAAWVERTGLVATQKITKIEMWKEPSGEIAVYTPEEVRTILSKVPKMAIPFVAIGAFAGMRAAEIIRLDWSEINLKRGFITVAAAKTKTAARRLVPISENLKAWLTPYAQESGAVIPLTDSRLNQLLRTKGIPRKRNALRHSYISYRLAVINDTPKVALECGNSPTMIFKHYRELVAPEAAKAWFEIMPA